MDEVKFVKWSSIDNLETAEKTSRDYQKAKNLKTSWVVTEKIDGTNISINVTRDEVRVGKRTSLLGVGDSFYNVFQNLPKVEPLIRAMKEILDNHEDLYQVTVYGEYFGPQVINRIYYGSDYQFRFFGMFMTHKETPETPGWLAFQYVNAFFKFNDLGDLLVPILGHYDTFEEACKHPNNEVTTFKDEKHNDLMEGVVIVPFGKPAVSKEGNFLFKNKNPNFSEKHCKSRVAKNCETVEEKAMKVAKETFKEYCTESRMFSVISKEGKPTAKDAGKFIALFIQDAKEDFLKEHPEYLTLSDKEMKFVCNIGSLGFFIFSNVLNKVEENAM